MKLRISQFLLLASVWMSVCLVSCDTDDVSLYPDVPEKPVVVVFENDVHAASMGIPAWLVCVKG